MTKEEKQLLLKVLCAMLPYVVKGIHREQVHIITNMDGSGLYPSIKVDGYDAWFPIETFKPYLRPMSNMTEEEENELKEITRQLDFDRKHNMIYVGDANDGICNLLEMQRIIDYFNAHHFDHYGLIEKGLALEAPEGMYKIE